MASYSDLLKNPLWQRKRLTILNTHDFTCQKCGSTTKTLHFHHCYYEKGKKPWVYPDSALKCLCEDCHGVAGSRQLTLAKLMAEVEIEDEVLGYALGAYSWQEQDEIVGLFSYESASGFADYWGIDVETALIPHLTEHERQTSGRAILHLIATTGSCAKKWIFGYATRLEER